MQVREHPQTNGKHNLRGALEEYGIRNLLQLFQSARKTGELVLVNEERCARIYFVEGDLVHAEMDDWQGSPVLREIQDWDAGEFDFRTGVQPNLASIQGIPLDVPANPAGPASEAHPDCDDATSREWPEGPAATAAASPKDAKLCRRLEEFLGAQPSIRGAWVFERGGAVLASACGTAVQPGVSERLKDILNSLAGTYPRGAIRRLFIEDTVGLVVFLSLNDRSCLMVLAGEDAVLGAVTVAVGRLAAAIA